MKRKKKDSGEVRWRKIGGGSLRLPNKIIKSGQVFNAKPEDIPESFRDLVEPLEELPDQEAPDVVKGDYSLQQRSPGWFDVINSTGKVVNENALRREAALQLIKSFE